MNRNPSFEMLPQTKRPVRTARAMPSHSRAFGSGQAATTDTSAATHASPPSSKIHRSEPNPDVSSNWTKPPANNSPSATTSSRSEIVRRLIPSGKHAGGSGSANQRDESRERPEVLLAVAAFEHLRGEELVEGYAAGQQREVAVVHPVGEHDQTEGDVLVGQRA